MDYFIQLYKRKVNDLSNKKISLNEHDALLITDIQIDFLPGGSLPVEGGNEIIPVVNNYIEHFEQASAHIIASRDWHPANHISFQSQGGTWPPHCVQNTEGAKFSPDLKLPDHTIVISKAADAKHEAYSAFDETNLDNDLRQLGIRRLFVAGLATDYCVVNTVLDALKLGFDAVVLTDATLGINLVPGDVDRAFQAMSKNGAKQATDEDFAEPFDKLPIEETSSDSTAEKPSMLTDAKKKARMRSKGVSKRIKTEGRQ
jgi:nicotinamidase/pyrazinamidase